MIAADCDAAASAVDHQIRAVVLRGIDRIDVDREQSRRGRHPPVLGHHPVEVAPDRDDKVGLVPERTGRREVGRKPDGAGMVPSE